MTLNVHRCERTDGLVTELGALLSKAPGDPFVSDVVAVPTRGIERFLAQELSGILGTRPGGADGVCANVSFPSPVELVREVLASTVTAPVGATLGSDPWHPDRMVWPLLATIDDCAHAPWAQSLATHLGLTEAAGPRTDRRFAVASRLCRLFHSYGSQRPSLILEWAAGNDTDGAGSPIPDDLLWQAALWRALRLRIASPSPPERLATACQALRDDPGCVELPERISVFGPSRLPADQLAILRALAVHRELHLWLADPSPTLWSALGAGGDRPTATVKSASPELPPTPLRRGDDLSAGTVRNPLLRSLGRDSRELRLRLATLMSSTEPDSHTPADLADGNLLGMLQRDLRDDRDPLHPETEQPVLEAGDRSLQVHACHGPGRQAEVLREVILGLLEADPTLEPRDILVMCPDLATMAPLIAAAFSEPGPTASTADLRLRIADRTPEQANEVLAALDAMLALVPGRALLSEVLDLIARPPVRVRFALTEDDVERIEDLAIAAGVRWGLDDRTRASFQLTGLSMGTWEWGLDRILLGVGLSEDGLPVCHGVLPLDDVPSGDVSRVGRLAELVTRLRDFRDGCTGRHPLSHWVAVLEQGVTGMLDARGADAWQVPHALATIRALAEQAGPAAHHVLLSLADVRWMLAELLAGRPTRMNFRSGGLTVCGLVPMRSVPHRVVCLVGMDDGTFPRALAPDGDDVLARDPRIGERDPRSEDRQVLLDAIMAATDTLVITYTGADDRTNEPRPPCVPLGELLDAVDATARTAGGARARTQVVTHHPLQPFDPRNFAPGDLVPAGPFSHDVQALHGARAALSPRADASPLIGAPLPVERRTEVTLVELCRFLRAPAADHLRTRLGLSIDSGQDELDEVIPLELGGLAAWGIGERALSQLGQGRDAHQIVLAERARGVVPPGALGTGLSEVGHTAQRIADAVRTARSGEPRLLPIHLDLPSGRRLIGSVADVFDTTVVRATYSRPRPRTIVDLWPLLLAAVASEPGREWAATLVCRDEILRFRAPAAVTAAHLLDQLLDLLELGMSEPLPLPPATAMAYAEVRFRGHRISSAVTEAGRTWFTAVFDRATGERRCWGEATEPAHVLMYGPEAPLATLLAAPPGATERWAPDEETRFGALAMRLWTPILAAREAPE